jgi:hypothetical protein
VKVDLVDGVDCVDPEAWNRLAGEDDPFAEHAFLKTLEESGCVGEGTGWRPTHVLVREGARLVGALPLYAKDHSYGEFIFDFAWAHAAHRLRARYYPKLVSMAPFTPATGRRLLVAEDADRAAVIAAIARGAREAADRSGASSIHFLFLSAQEQAELAGHGFLPRLSYQFHWRNQGYGSFDEYTDRFRAKARKELRRERARVAALGLEIRVVEGRDLDVAEWRALEGFYRDTCARYGMPPYLNADFFSIARRRLAHRIVAALALEGGRPVAGSLNFEKGGHLYGRTWGALAQFEGLHFELCYHRLIERCIARGLSHFEAGAGGLHKLRRGLLPSAIHSAHWIRHPTLAAAVAEFLPRETAAVRAEMDALSPHGPFRREAHSAPAS